VSSPDDAPTTPYSPRQDTWRLSYAVLAFVAVVLAGRLVGDAVARAPGVPPAVTQQVSYLVVWLPLSAALVMSCVGLGRGGTLRLLGLRLRPLDLLWGLGVAVVARALDAGVNLLLTGATGLEPRPLLDGGPTGAVLVVGVLAPVVVAPLVEELYFRGLVQRTTSRALIEGVRLPRWSAVPVAVLTTSLAFAVLHLAVGSFTPVGQLVVGVGTFLFGALVGTLVAVTGRIGGALVAHVAFNGIAVAATWPR